MGNNCLQQNQTINQKEKVIRINVYPDLKYPSKQILHQSIQNIQQNLDTFEEDFFKSEFIFDFTNDNITNHCSSKQQLERIQDEEQNDMQCPSLNFFGDAQIQFQYQINLNTSQEDPLNQAFMQEKKQERRSQQKKKKQFKKLVQKKVELKGILKQRTPSPSSFSNLSNRSGKHSVTFKLSQININNKNTRSLSPIIQSHNSKQKNVHHKSMIFMKQFPYL
ncbi:unnamed protein product (macronuclear) [Paramecium tetraurelia]|uniref:Uncharacterized protein n=1 Tax=Paramecium tetraurelia TaxID=5888 RepID=A0CWR8_PARTE|nr:uncharacterized protein GSPATT00001438001 [Paramecium tetraurelia]CAK75235.1 unnamed protein product [Paramecium tetraurelia]|eukprot:XP_001442632.1 hypothetical protein (macronuclear) [Paramecium tetraurelia strain d4-2]